MSGFQKMIKYIAMAFGFFLAFVIISSIVSVVLGVAGLGMLWDGTQTTTEIQVEDKTQYSEEFADVENLTMDIAISNLTIIEGTEFKVEGTNLTNTFSAKQRGNTLHIKEDKFNLIGMSDIVSNIVITIPKGTKLNKVELEMGAGNAKIDNLVTQQIELDLGAGNIEIESIEAQRAEIQGGAGKITINNAKLANMNLETGVGKFEFAGRLEGNNSVECGVGKVDIALQNSQDDYSIYTQTGLGAIRFNGSDCADKTTYGTGKTRLRIEGGVGSIDITTQE